MVGHDFAASDGGLAGARARSDVGGNRRYRLGGVEPAMSPKGYVGTKAPHGTHSRYSNHGCRCEECRAANTRYNLAYRHRTGRSLPMDEYLSQRRADAEARHNHGTETRYQLGCRCDKCRVAAAVARAQRRAAERERRSFQPTCPRCGEVCPSSARYCTACAARGRATRLYPASFYPERRR